MSRSQEEELCKEAFNEYLKSMCDKDLLWYNVPLVDEPPDFYLDINNQKYAVEVTSFSRYAKLKDKMVPVRSISESLFKFIDTIEGNLKKKSLLKGTYNIYFCGICENFNYLKNELKMKIEDFIIGNADGDPTDLIDIYADSRFVCKISKTLISDKRLSGMYQESSRGYNIFKFCLDLLCRAINDKTLKLSKITEKKILLIYNAYILGTPEIYRECIKKISNKSNFYTIALVDDDYEVSIIYKE